jgi:hypothetical protein
VVVGGTGYAGEVRYREGFEYTSDKTLSYSNSTLILHALMHCVLIGCVRKEISYNTLSRRVTLEKH